MLIPVRGRISAMMRGRFPGKGTLIGDGCPMQLPISVGNTKAFLATVDSLQEVRDIRDKAAAATKYAKAAELGLEAQNECAEVKLWSERRAGELLRQMKEGGERDKGGHGKIESRSATQLSSLGISKTQSSRWQMIAEVPESKFQKLIEETKKASKELTTSSVITVAKTDRKKAKQKKSQSSCTIESDCVLADASTLLASGQKFPCIYADPPWKYGNQGTRASTDNHYQTLSVDELCDPEKWPVAQLVADNAHLHLWTTNAFFPDSFRLMEAWGFEYKSIFVWVKPTIGMGNYWRVSHELLLLGVRGSLDFQDRSLRSWLEAKRGKHSAKPEAVRALVEKASPGPRLEIFGREQVTGWTVLGNQVSPQGRLL